MMSSTTKHRDSVDDGGGWVGVRQGRGGQAGEHHAVRDRVGDASAAEHVGECAGGQQDADHERSEGPVRRGELETQVRPDELDEVQRGCARDRGSVDSAADLRERVGASRLAGASRDDVTPARLRRSEVTEGVPIGP